MGIDPSNPDLIPKEYVYTRELADELKVSFPTIKKWADAIGLPYAYDKKANQGRGGIQRKYLARYVPYFVQCSAYHQLHNHEMLILLLGSEGINPEGHIKGFPELKYKF